MIWPIKTFKLSVVFIASCFIYLFSLTSCEQINAEWHMYSADHAGSKYSAADQINKSNVKNLELAWAYETGDMRKKSTIECNPIIIEGVMYATSPSLKVMALNAATGEELWRFDPFEGKRGSGVNRGVSYWSEGEDKRIYFVAGSYIYALSAKTGLVIESFGNEGTVDLHEGLGRNTRSTWVTAATPGIIYKNLLILGSTLGEGPNAAAPGHIRAYDVISGEMKWIFHTIPQPGEFGYETWPEDAYLKTGGTNAWGGFTLDMERETLFCGTGSPTYDHWGGDRLGNNLFGNCILALDVNTGERKWHYQVVHHDIWDYDIPCPPNLVTVNIDGKEIDALAQPTKMGHLFVLNRETGEPIFPIEEVEVPQSTVPGEKTSPTQPFPPKSLRYAQQTFTTNEVTDLNENATKAVLEQLKDLDQGGVFLPPSMNGAVTLPQFNGGTDWGGASYNPTNNMLYVNCSNEAEWISMVESKPVKEISKNAFGSKLYRAACSSCHGTSSPKNVGAPPLEALREIKKTKDKTYVFDLLQTGRAPMPSFASLSDHERDAIVAFLWDEGQDEILDIDSLELSFSNDIKYVATGHHQFFDPEGFPANKRPWATLNAIDLNKGEIAWQVPLGTYPELEKRGLPPTGTFNMGGPIATAGDVVFIGATMDERFRAFDADSGEVLWEYQMNAGGYATPATYEVDGKQYVVIAAGGGGKPGTRAGDKYYCFTLPD